MKNFILDKYAFLKRQLAYKVRQTYFFRTKTFDYIYKNNFHQYLWERSPQNHEIMSLIDSLHISKESFILDAGCGSGRDSLFLLNSGYKNVYGFDVSSKAIKRLQSTNTRTNFIVADAKRLPYPGAMFDVCFDVGLLHCLSPSEQVMMRDELLRVLKERGYYILKVFRKPPLDSKMPSRVVSTTIDDKKIRFPIWWLNIEDIKRIFQRDFDFISINEYMGDIQTLGYIIAIMRKRTISNGDK